VFFLNQPPCEWRKNYRAALENSWRIKRREMRANGVGLLTRLLFWVIFESIKTRTLEWRRGGSLKLYKINELKRDHREMFNKRLSSRCFKLKTFYLLSMIFKRINSWNNIRSTKRKVLMKSSSTLAKFNFFSCCRPWRII
jgi:hypothetical protein